jgi:hypothetical protein
MKRIESKHSLKKDDKFGRLTIISYTDRPGKKGEYKCECECGNITYSSTDSLKRGRSRSCGCLMKEKASDRFKLPDNLGFIKELYRNYKSSAIRRKYDFNLDISKFRDIIESPCYYCNEKDSMGAYGFHKGINYRYNGVDRVNNEIGYIDGNVVACCKICNNSKSTLTNKDFKNWILKIYNNLENF